ncbi:MAG: SRPBCC domain-containing protein [Bacteroidetes bacterium]|nr:SRPBCC domain-containing protein [Bacteroidales bacterium]NJO69423.1 SRPBCC domain-containing protein [Bacteroidota bacterium]
MKKGLEVNQSIELNVSLAEVWKALTDPGMIKQYFFGTTAVSDWKAGSPVKFTGEWEGQAYEDKGTILESVPGKKLVYNYWSSFSGTPDTEENYANITYELKPSDNGTLLVISQDGIENEEKKNHSEQSWKEVLNNLKDLLYSKSLA